MHTPLHHFAVSLFCLGSLTLTPQAFARVAVAPSPAEQRLVDLANETRTQLNLPALKWDSSLAIAARLHAERVAAEHTISHQFPGEPDLSARAATAGVHFSLIEENVAVAPLPETIHDEWMHSEHHHANLVNPNIDSIGVAVIDTPDGLYAVADYAESVIVLTTEQIEAKVTDLLVESGVAVIADADLTAAMRTSCGQDSGVPPGTKINHFMMRWQSGSLSELPDELANRITSRGYKKAAVGACFPPPVEGEDTSFTSYHVAVLVF